MYVEMFIQTCLANPTQMTLVGFHVHFSFLLSVHSKLKSSSSSSKSPTSMFSSTRWGFVEPGIVTTLFFSQQHQNN